MAIAFNYFRPGRVVSSRAGKTPRRRAIFAAAAAAVLAAAVPAAAQYAGRVPEHSKKNGPDLRAVAVLEWTGEPGHPKASRLVPITLWDGQDLQDASLYKAQPEPLALQSDVEYKLEQGGKTIGLYDVSSAGQSQGTWVGFGAWKPLPKPKAAAAPQKVADNSGDDGGPPILHRAHHADNASTPAPPPDPNRPILREPPKETKPAAEKPHNETAYSQPLPNISDPDRPRLIRGKPEASGPPVVPTLAGLPPDMHQTIAVSDAENHPDHIWTYTWADPNEAAKMKTDLEDIARKALAPPPAAAPPKPEHRRIPARRGAKISAPPPPPQVALQDEKFHAFQLTYGGPATMVFSARTPGAGAQEKYITLIAQPDLYGNVLVLFKQITDTDDLDETPAMHLIDPVDAMADNRGELLFELRGATQREFALYRVVDGKVQKLFTSAPESVAMPAAPPTGS